MTGPQMRNLRKRLSLSQTAFGEIIGYGIAQIRKFETAKAEIPRSTALACAALALGLTEYPKDSP